jgi:ribosomal-protein-alanine N-acetyltransferase
MSRPELPVLTGERVTLRRPVPADAEARRHLGNDPEIVRMYGGSSSGAHPMTEDEAKRWVQKIHNHDYAWVIEVGSLIGSIRLDRVDFQDKRAAMASRTGRASEQAWAPKQSLLSCNMHLTS